MAKTNAILGSDRSAAATVALVVLCALGLVQLGTIVQSAWRGFRSDSAGKAVPAPVIASAPAPALAAPSAPAPAPVAKPSSTAPTTTSPVAAAVATGLPPLPPVGTGINSLPPLPTATSGLPPLPDLRGTGLKPVALPPSARTAPSVSALPVARPSGLVNPMAPAARPSAPAVKSGPPTVAKTGKAQVDELIDVAAQSRELGDADGAMQALERADLMLPDNPIILREKALTFGKLGQVDKAQQLWDRIERLGPGAGTESAPMTSAPPPPPVNEGGLNGAFASLSDSAAPKGPIWLGECQVSRDLTAAKGQKLVLKIPVIAKPGVSIGVDDWNLDVLFYDRVDEVRVEPTKADPVVYTSDTDPATGNMVISAVYHMPELSPQDVANIGHREYYGYIVKLYYQHRLMSTAASPRDLLNNPGGPGATAAPASNPLLPLPRP